MQHTPPGHVALKHTEKYHRPYPASFASIPSAKKTFATTNPRQKSTKEAKQNDRSDLLRLQPATTPRSIWLLVLTSIIAVTLQDTNLLAQPNNNVRSSQAQPKPFHQATQQVLDSLTRAEIAREQVSLAGNHAEKLVPLRKQFRNVIARLREIKTQLAQLLRETYKKRPSTLGPNDWTLRELESLGRNLQGQLARAYRNQALCYPQNSTDRIHALNLALEQLSGIVSQPISDASVWHARIEQTICLRLLQKQQLASQQIQQWQKSAPPKKFASRLAAERLLLDLQAGNLSAALTLVDALQSDNRAAVAETDDAILKTLLAALQQAEASQTARLLQRAKAQLHDIKKNHGPYWLQRARMRFGLALAGLALAEPASVDDPQLLTYAAASLYETGKLDESIELYDRIATRLSAPEETDQKFQAAKTAAAIVRKRNQLANAQQRFRQLAIEQPQHAEAAHVHLIAIGLAAQRLRTSPAQQHGKAFESYRALLVEHLKQWPQQPTAAKVRQWIARTELPEIEHERARTLATTGNHQQAVLLYRKLIEASPNDPELLEAFANLLGTKTDPAELREAMTLWRQIEQRSEPGGPRWARGRLARLTLLERLGEGEKAKQLRQLTELLYPSYHEQ